MIDRALRLLALPRRALRRRLFRLVVVDKRRRVATFARATLVNARNLPPYLPHLVRFRPWYPIRVTAAAWRCWAVQCALTAALYAFSAAAAAELAPLYLARARRCAALAL